MLSSGTVAILVLLALGAIAVCALLAPDEPSAGDLDHMDEATRAKVIPLRRQR